jgi:hypothetical protein
MYSEFDVRKEIESIENGDGSPIRKARRLISLSRNIRRFSRHLHRGAGILREDDDQCAAERLQQTLNSLRRLQDEARLSAFKALKARPSNLAFEVNPERQAYPFHWNETKESLEAQPSYN